jgi:hypothetical protein
MNSLINKRIIPLLMIAAISLRSEGPAFGKNFRPGVRVIFLDEMTVAPVAIHPDGTVISFPAKPEVHVGKADAFNIVYVRNDLVISPNSASAKTNLFVYLLGRRFTLKLAYSAHAGDEIVAIRDPAENRVEPE